ncbi:MAG: DUF4406 domain-containing protein [Parcubacteria group bacterium]|nr:DUF4406 domain-containing protein [Parcubacteria group bacterium]
MSLKYWDQEHFDKLETSLTYKDLFTIAEDVLRKMPPPVGQVCGPISTGGAGSVEKNLKRFEEAIINLQQQGIEIFDQVPFEVPMQRIKNLRECGDYDNSLLYDFYLPIFESKLIHRLYFLPDWESSTGAKWEHEQALRLGLDIEYM